MHGSDDDAEVDRCFAVRDAHICANVRRRCASAQDADEATDVLDRRLAPLGQSTVEA